MKRVLFDGLAIQPSSQAPFHGGSEYAKCILHEILERSLPMEIVFRKSLPIPDEISKLLSNSNCRVHFIASKAELYQLIDNGDFDTFYSAIPYSYFDYDGRIPIIGVIHGLRTIEFPWDRYYYRFIKSRVKKPIGWLISTFPYLWNCVKRRNINRMSRLILNPKFRFITVSEHSKYSILNFFPSLRSEEIEVCYSPLNISRTEKSEPANQGNYYLLVSGNRAEKNVTRTLLAFDDLFSKGLLPDKTVKITGVTNPEAFSFIKNKNKFSFLPYVTSSELDTLYREAFCFVYPSLNEGFGYPPLQAMACSVPIIASSATSIPEVCGNAAIYFSPTNLDDLKSRILQINDNPSLRKHLVDNGIIRLNEIQSRQKADIEKQINLIFN